MPGNPDPRGYYALLHVSPEASRQEIGRAFRALMRRHHPDRHHPDMRQMEIDPSGGSGVSADGSDASAILRAFAVLRDARTRAEYDAAGWRADVQNSSPPHQDSRPHQDSQAGPGGRDIPVRIIRRRDPLVRVLPVHWESGP